MAKHIPAMIWLWRRLGRYPNGYVSTASQTELKLGFYPDDRGGGFSFTIRRRDAKLLVDRIMRCLEESK